MEGRVVGQPRINRQRLTVCVSSQVCVCVVLVMCVALPSYLLTQFDDSRITHTYTSYTRTHTHITHFLMHTGGLSQVPCSFCATGKGGFARNLIVCATYAGTHPRTFHTTHAHHTHTLFTTQVRCSFCATGKGGFACSHMII